MSGPRLVPHLLPHLGAEPPAAPAVPAVPAVIDVDRLEALLQVLVATARAAWPSIQVPVEELVGFLARRLPPDEPLEAVLAELRVAELYLICAHLGGDARATELLAARYLPSIDETLGRMRLAPADEEELRQAIRDRVLFGTDERGPAIASYAGRGELRAWLRVVSVNEAHQLLRRDARERPVETDRLLSLAVADDDQEMAYLKHLYRAEFDAAFREAMAALSSRDRNILRFLVVKRLGIDRIANTYRVHRVTMSRWVATIREQLLERTQQALQRRLRIGADEMQSILRLIQSRLEVNVEELLRDEE